MAYRVEINREACIGAGSCVVFASNTFDVDEENLVVLKKQNGDSDEDILSAAQSCPVDAIVVFDDAGNQIWPEKK